MSVGSPKLARREEAMKATRRRLRRLEIETHRIKAELARLEAEYEDDVADWLSRKLRRRVVPTVDTLSVVSPSAGAPAVIRLDPKSVAEIARFPTAELAAIAAQPVKPVVDRAPLTSGKAPPRRLADAGPKVVPQAANRSLLHVDRQRNASASARKAASPLLCSFAVHAVVLSICFTITIATIAQQPIDLVASPAELDEIIAEEISEVQIEPTRFDDAELQNVVADNQEFNLADNQAREFEPADLGVGIHSLGEIGQLDALPSELGTLMAGAGDPGSGRPGGPVGEAVFFGARSKGDRFVFVVDNSSSMKGGRLEVAIAELKQSVDSLSPRQSFYVIFVSDQPYPMFYPEPAPALIAATAPNKERLAEWLPKAILASGKNRELITAMDMAAALQPHAVFLLWDGDLKYSDKVRLDVMTHLTRPDNNWDFTVHTLGMGVTSLDAQQNLAAIAQAHGGTFSRIDVPAAGQR
jgi:hypothetical protein